MMIISRSCRDSFICTVLVTYQSAGRNFNFPHLLIEDSQAWVRRADGSTHKFWDGLYEYDVQSYRNFEPFTVGPNDLFEWTCTVNNKFDYPVKSGQGTQDEMCQVFIEYYPRQNSAMCYNAAHPVWRSQVHEFSSTLPDA